MSGNSGRSNGEHKNSGLYLFNWIALATLAAFIFIFLPLVGFSLELDREAWGALFLSATLIAAGHFLLLRDWTRLAFVVLSIAQLGLLSMLAALLTYIAASASFPLQDIALDRWDRALGLDWPAYYRFLTARPRMLPYVYLSYAAIAMPPFGVPMLLGLTRNHLRLQRFVTATLFTLCIVAVLSALIPAIGTYKIYRLPTEFTGYAATGYLIQLARLPVIRSGDLHVLSLSQIGGIVTFPSFHAAAAVLALWGWWGVWWMRPWALMMCVAMLVATPLLGGHYFVDIFAGGFVAGLAIVLASLVGEFRSRAPAEAGGSQSIARA